MKITQVADYFDAHTGNPLAVFAKKLSWRKHEVDVFTSNIAEKPGKLDDNNIKVKIERFAAIKIGSKAVFPMLIPKLVLSKNLGIVHAHVLGFYSLFACALLKPIKKYPFVITPDFNVKNPKYNFPKNIINYFLMKFPLMQADIILPFTETERQELKKRFNVPLQKMVVLPIGTDIPMFNKPSKKDYRKELGLQDKFILLSASFLQPVKKIESVLEALKNIQKNVVFVHVGGVNDKAYKKKLDEIVGKNKLEERVFFLGKKSIEEIVDVYKCADAFILTSTKESYCVALVEALAAGLPIITTKVGAAPEIIIEGENGFFAESAEEIKKATDSLFEDYGLREKISTTNRKKAKKYNWDQIISLLEKQYSLLASKKIFKL